MNSYQVGCYFQSLCILLALYFTRTPSGMSQLPINNKLEVLKRQELLHALLIIVSKILTRASNK